MLVSDHVTDSNKVVSKTLLIEKVVKISAPSVTVATLSASGDRSLWSESIEPQATFLVSLS